MKLSTSLAAQIAVLMNGPPEPAVQYLFTFGNSYTTTGFNSSLTQPTTGNPMGNPTLGQGTITDGVNWVGYYATIYNTSLVLNYNFARYGATINNSIVDNGARDLVTQLSQDFYPYYCSPPTQGPAWNAKNSLFALWFGINDVQFSYLSDDPMEKLTELLVNYFQLIEDLYECGARRFIVINVPPTTRTPVNLSLRPKQRERHRRHTDEYNHRLKEGVADFQQSHHQVSMVLYDSWSFMTKVLETPAQYGFKNETCIGEGCIWWDDEHPTSAFHNLLAADLAALEL